jgi:hypothetical protein
LDKETYPKGYRFDECCDWFYLIIIIIIEKINQYNK